MQFLKISNNVTLAELTDRVGSKNIEYVIAENNLPRVVQIGKAFKKMCDDAVANAREQQTDPTELMVDWQRRMSILNTMVQDSDIFEEACSLTDAGWVILSVLNTFPKMLRIPYEIFTLPDAVDVLGDGDPVDEVVYAKVANFISTYPYEIPSSVFSEYNASPGLRQRRGSVDAMGVNIPTVQSVMQWFQIPWGKITLYSSLTGTQVDFPVYPEEISDGRHANYETMPDLIYQYEPWQLYTSSGPRNVTYKFDFHRDMWTGDHRDGKANELIRFCEAQCYPEYKGSFVNTSTCTLYVSGKSLITGILTEVSTDWSGPLGLDGWYLHCVLTLTFTEVSKEVLDHRTVMQKPLIG